MPAHTWSGLQNSNRRASSRPRLIAHPTEFGAVPLLPCVRPTHTESLSTPPKHKPRAARPSWTDRTSPSAKKSAFPPAKWPRRAVPAPEHPFTTRVSFQLPPRCPPFHPEVNVHVRVWRVRRVIADPVE